MIKKSIRNNFLTNIITTSIAGFSMSIFAWFIGAPNLMFFVISVSTLFLILLSILFSGLEYLNIRPMIIMYEKIEKELGNYKILAVLSGDEFKLNSKPSLLIETSTDEVLRIEILTDKQYTKHSVE